MAETYQIEMNLEQLERLLKNLPEGKLCWRFVLERKNMEKTHKIDVVSIRLVEEPPLYSSKELKNPCDVAELFQDFLKDCDREMFCILNLRTKNQVINVNVVGMGTLNSVLVHPREVFKSAILSNASNIILAHNHPSGDPEPSRHDIEVTKRLAEAGNLMGIEVLDHIVVAENRYFSFREENILPEYFQMGEVAAEQSLPYVKSEKEKVH